MNNKKLSVKQIAEYTIMGIFFFLPAIGLLVLPLDPEVTHFEASLGTYVWVGVCIATYNSLSILGGDSLRNISSDEKKFIDIFRSLNYEEQKQLQKTINNKLKEIYDTRSY